VEHERILAKIDELDNFIFELRQIMPASLKEYQEIEKRRACERLLQISIECIIDISSLLVSNLRLGLPSEEDDLFGKLEATGVISSFMKENLQKMKGFRNILVHRYGQVDDQSVYKVLQTGINDFIAFKQIVLSMLKKS
jgi:uncharacterized protein YutE (UPF0331/DUF86 family)